MSTEEKQLDTEQNTENSIVNPGDILRQKREQLGWSQQDVADRLRLKLAVVKNIEANSFDSKQVATFIRGYFRSYAKLVGVDEREVLEALTGNEQARLTQQPMQSFSHQTKKQQSDNRIMRLTWLILLVIVGISSAWWWQNQQQDTLAPQNQEIEKQNQATLEQELAPDDMAVPAAEGAEPEATENASDVVADEAKESEESKASEPATEPQVVEPTSATEAAPQSQSQAIAKALQVHFENDCWIQIKDANGKTLQIGLKKAGQRINLSAQAPVSVVLGTTEGVKLTFADKAVDLSGYAVGKVARLTLP